MKIIDLDVDFDKIRVIQQNAFGKGRFADVRKLTLYIVIIKQSKFKFSFCECRFVVRNLWPEEYLYVYTFDGLGSLENITFLDAQLVSGPYGSNLIITYGMLQFAKDRLNTLTLTERVDEYHRSFSIQRMLGDRSATLTNLEYVNVKYNLSIINSQSFTAIPYVRILDLSGCYISAIEADSFDNLNKTLLTLNLANNRLVTLPDGIFMTLNLIPIIADELFVNSETTLTIYLSDNPWHCGCKLIFTKDLFNQYSNFQGDFSCKSPPEIENYPIKESDFCPCPITTTTSIPTETTETYSDNYLEKECFSFDHIAENYTVLIQSQMKEMELSVTADEDVLVVIESMGENLALIWFGSDTLRGASLYYVQSSNIDCISSLRKEIVITNLDKAKVYTFCLINITHTTVTPLDCISYYHREYNKIWFPESSQPLVIGVIVTCLVLSNIVGMTVAIIFHRCWCIEHSATTSNGKKTESTDTPPELPPHPRFPQMEVIDGDIYYEIVK